MMFEPFGQLPPPPRPRPRAGECRVCGCTADQACVTSWWRVDEEHPSDFARRLRETVADTPARTCGWTDDTRTLCTRCHGTRQPTAYQLGELIRIRQVLGRVRVVAAGPGAALVIEAPGQRLGLEQIPRLTLDPYGKVRGTTRKFRVGEYGVPSGVAA